MAREHRTVTQPRRAAVLGSPISHSLSPALHEAAYRALGLDWEYGSIDVTVDRFPQVLDELQADPTFGGVSLTMPLKEVGLAAADIASDVARKTHAANTLIFRGGSIEADNTDPEGIVWALNRAGIAAGAGAVVESAGIVGAGATARSTVAALAHLGIAEVHVVARRPEAITDLREVAEAFGLRVHLCLRVTLLSRPRRETSLMRWCPRCLRLLACCSTSCIRRGRLHWLAHGQRRVVRWCRVSRCSLDKPDVRSSS